MNETSPGLNANSGSDTLGPDSDPWQALAACADIDPDVFFPEIEALDAEAKAVCAVCPVRGECLDYALTNREKTGVWGGLNGRERRRLIRQRGQQRRAGRSQE